MPERNSKLKRSDRMFIEDGIAARSSMSSIAKALGVSTSTVTREIRRNRVPDSPKFRTKGVRNICSKKGSCRISGLCEDCSKPCAKCGKGICNDVCGEFEAPPCPAHESAPFVCNTCSNRFGWGCSHPYLFYDAHMADEAARQRRVDSRIGIDITEEQLEAMNRLVTPLIKNGQSPEHIWATHADELPVTFRTYYKYVKMGITSVIPLDLPKAVRFKPRKKAKADPAPRGSLEGHLYEDFLALPEELREKAVQMDTVKGKRGEVQAILTLTWPQLEFQLPIFMEVEDQERCEEIFDMLEGLLGPDDFSKVFEIVLTDRGGPFLDPAKLEFSSDGRKRCSVYYCDAQAPNQKASCERTHGELRRIIPKGTSLVKFEKRDMPLIASHLNSYLKPSLNYVPPLSKAMRALPVELIEAFGIELIPPDEVVLKPKLIAHILAR